MLKGYLVRIVVIAALAVLLLSLLNMYMVNAKDVSKLEKIIAQPTVIYGHDGKLASKLSNAKVDWVDYENIPPSFIHALVATEDRDFFKHGGVDYYGIARAAVKNVTSGGVVEGGSTLTQQLAKNVFLTHQKTFTRKFDEYFYAKKIEKEYSKENILELYANHVYFGEGAWGLGRASQIYFGKQPKELSQSEAAVLAGLIKAPSAYSPVKNMEKAKERRNLVLSLMAEQGYITKEEAEKDKKESIQLKQKKTDPFKGKYPSYVDQIVAEAEQKYNIPQGDLLSGGYKIYTEMDQDMQAGLEDVYKDDKLFPKSSSDQMVQSGSVLIDPKTGGIRALVGGRGVHSFRQFNHATQLKRQPGSSLKPIVDYAPALEKGFDVYSSLKDEPLNLKGYSPENYDHQYRGTVTMYDALVHSYNVPAVYTLNEIGIQAGLDSAAKFGIPVTKEDRQLGLALGGLSRGVSPLNMAEAFSAFPNGGVREASHTIVKIIGPSGKVEAMHKKEETRAVSKENADKITYMLKGVINEGTGKKAKLEGGRELAGKTGTTQLAEEGTDGSKDQWFAGYTPNLAGAVWVGYDHTSSENYLTDSATDTAAPIFKAIMDRAVKNLPAEKFQLPVYEKPYTPPPETEKKKKPEEDKAKEKPKDAKKEQNSKKDNKDKEKKKENGDRKEKDKKERKKKEDSKDNKDQKDPKSKEKEQKDISNENSN
ncbi:PBP1A family penicillin-binding protein [Metabacillus sp. GX 13764]|nr:PBP1A family penicillin-binding protein [Metabacillus kandeliae]MCD7034814.1 PBP1A family penicillin-binding protein [Metabacillus kandeliae]